ncbi:hypothetical protein AB0M42_32405 [Streptomyces sp. NPDC051784]|uniref:hypothetical protein n=1 Tax=Streptomyces sp. NPDC051784 TaxID=3155805 RepID=UPI0034242DFA
MRSDAGMRQGLAGQTALGRVSEPEEIGDAIATLASEGLHWMTSQRVEVSGGVLLCPSERARTGSRARTCSTWATGASRPFVKTALSETLMRRGRPRNRKVEETRYRRLARQAGDVVPPPGTKVLAVSRAKRRPTTRSSWAVQWGTKRMLGTS